MGELFGGIEVFADARPDDGVLDVGVLTSEGPVQLVRAAARTAVGSAEKSPFVRVTQGRKVRVKLDRKVRYELDGGDRKKVKHSRSMSNPARSRCACRAGPETEGERDEDRRGAGVQNLGDKAKGQGDELAHAKALGWLARAGLVARGVVYLIIGVLALKLALGDGGKATNQTGALKTIAEQSFGEALLILRRDRPGGLLALEAAPSRRRPWRRTARQRLRSRLRARQRHRLRDPLHHGGENPHRIRRRLGDAEGNDRRRSGLAGGTVIVAIAGAFMIGVAVYQAYKGLAKKFLDDAKTGEMSEGVRKGYTALGVFGHVARAVVFALIGYGLIKAALDYNPKEAIGLDGALRELAHASYGPALLGLVAVGLAGFALYSIADARYRKV